MTPLTRADLAGHVQRWSAEPMLRGREWVPRFAYHFTDVRNAAGVLQQGCLLPRGTAVERGLMVSDNASGSVIGSTREEAKEHARLYFRPGTPTQYRNEGIRSEEKRELGAHCPVPVFFVFDLIEVLSYPGVRFSDGSLARRQAGIGDSKEFFDAIPFASVYHDAAFPPSDRDEIVFRRQAEILVPGGLRLDHLVHIVCRSDAERRTLLHLASDSAKPWVQRVTTADKQFFCHRGSFVQSVQSHADQLVVELSLSAHASVLGASVEIEVVETTGKRRVVFDTTMKGSDASVRRG